MQESFWIVWAIQMNWDRQFKSPSDGTTHDFKLTGILDVKTGDIGDYYIGLKGAQNMSEEEATNYANTWRSN